MCQPCLLYRILTPDSNLLGAFLKYINIDLISFIFIGEITGIIIRAKYLKIMLTNVK